MSYDISYVIFKKTLKSILTELGKELASYMCTVVLLRKIT